MDSFFSGCLFYHVNALSRQMLKLADTEFKPFKLSPAHASLLLVILDQPGISPTELSRQMQLSPSTITRFMDALTRKKLLRRKNRGKTIQVFPTEKCRQLKPDLAKAYLNLYRNYTKILGQQTAATLSRDIEQAGSLMAAHFKDDNDPAQ